MAASALVAVPGPADSILSSTARSIDPASIVPISIALPTRLTATSIISTDIASRSAGRLGPAAAMLEIAGPEVAPAKGRVVQPSAKVKTIHKGAWHLDRNISWYGPGFYGQGTACGKKLTKAIMGVAHRTLPCGTLVTFRNPANGRQVTVPVIDRGPYTAGRTWDMSYGMCNYLRNCHTGSIQWRLAGGAR
jgi:rare lipoprotein A (peptidoglycan hydrolase)